MSRKHLGMIITLLGVGMLINAIYRSPVVDATVLLNPGLVIVSGICLFIFGKMTEPGDKKPGDDK